MGSSDAKLKKSDLGVTVFEVSLSSFVAAFLDGVNPASVDMAVSAGFDTLGKLKEADVKALVKKARLKESAAMLLKYGIQEHEAEMDGCIRSGKVKLTMPGLAGSPLADYSFCFTGPLLKMDRTEAKERIRALGGIAFNTVKRNLSFLVTNDTESFSDKNRAAKDFGIPVIDEQEFYALLDKPELAPVFFERGYREVKEADNSLAVKISLGELRLEKEVSKLRKVFAEHREVS